MSTAALTRHGSRGVARRALLVLAGDRPLPRPVERLPAAARRRASGRAAREGAGRPRPERARAASTSSTSSSAARAMFESLFPWIHTRRDARAGEADRAAGRERQGRAAGRPARDDDLAEGRRRSRAPALGYKVVAKPSGVIVAAIAADSHAVGKLQPSDVIVAVNGVPTPTIARLRAQLAKREARRHRDARDRARRAAPHRRASRRSPTTANKKRAIVGFSPAQAADIKLPLQGPDRRRQRRRPVGRPRVRARGDGGARPATSTAATASPRPGRSSSTAPSRRSAASSRRRSACARRRRTSSSCLWGQRRGGAALRTRPADHRCEEFSPGVAGPGNTAAETARKRLSRSRSKLPEIRQFSSAATLASRGIRPSIAAESTPASLEPRTNEQTSQSNLQ